MKPCAVRHLLTPHSDGERFVIILQLAKDTLSKTQLEMKLFYSEWCAAVGPATHLCGPLGISRTVNLNCATNSPGHGKKKENPQQIIHSKMPKRLFTVVL